MLYKLVTSTYYLFFTTSFPLRKHKKSKQNKTYFFTEFFLLLQVVCVKLVKINIVLWVKIITLILARKV